jgi:ATP-binding cassette subfamily F protein uup
VGGYTDWRRQGGRFPSEGGSRKASKPPGNDRPAPSAEPAPASPGTQSTKAKPAKLSYKLKLELEQLPGQIEKLESELEDLRQRISDPEFYSGPAENVSATLADLADKEGRLEKVIERWMELEEQADQ